MYQLNKGNSFGLKRSSQTFPSEQLLKILGTKEAYATGHFEYPAPQESKRGNHLDAIYVAEPIVKVSEFLEAIVEDMALWIEREQISFDVILSPAQDSARLIVDKLAARLTKRVAYLGCFKTGWFGAKIIEGEITSGERVLVFTTVDQTGRGVGETLPKIVEQCGGTTAGAAVFCKGTGGGVISAEHKYGKKFYASIQAHIGVRPSTDCHLCKMDKPLELKPWTDIRDAATV